MNKQKVIEELEKTNKLIEQLFDVDDVYLAFKCLTEINETFKYKIQMPKLDRQLKAIIIEHLIYKARKCEKSLKLSEARKDKQNEN